jgi:cell division cycle 20, cofactor of APC complex
MSSYFGATVAAVDDFDTFSNPVADAPMPRWQRKANEASASCFGFKTPKSGKRSKTPSGDRFIPNRSAMDLDMCRHALNFDSQSGKENGETVSPASPGSKASTLAGYNSTLASSLLGADPRAFADAANSGSDLPTSKILAFRNKAPEPAAGHQNPHRVLYSGAAAAAPVARRNMFRHIPQQPEKILDAPALLEDFYLNILDWGTNNVLAVALAETVYLWNAQHGTIAKLCETTHLDDCVTSVSWAPDGQHLAVGTNSAEVQIWDAEKMTCVRKMRSHAARIGALAWNDAVLASGSRDSQIHNHDTRIAQHHVATLSAHTQEVCGLKWNHNGTQLASGANDNTVCIWDSDSSQTQWKPKFQFTDHTAAVKALAWCPWQTNILATGGGTADRHLRFWNTTTGTCVNSVDTNSQVSSIVFSPHEKELVTGHGFSQNQLTVWKYPTLVRMAELKGHSSRVLHMALSPDGQTVVSAAADETLRFWKVFAANESAKASRGGNMSKADSGLSSKIRNLNIR